MKLKFLGAGRPRKGCLSCQELGLLMRPNDVTPDIDATFAKQLVENYPDCFVAVVEEKREPVRETTKVFANKRDK